MLHPGNLMQKVTSMACPFHKGGIDAASLWVMQVQAADSSPFPPQFPIS